MGVGGQPHVPAALAPGKNPVPIVQEAEWAPGSVWTGVENTAAFVSTVNHICEIIPKELEAVCTVHHPTICI